MDAPHPASPRKALHEAARRVGGGHAGSRGPQGANGAKATGARAAALEPQKSRRLYLLLRDRIANGALPPGARLPGEPTLAAEHGIARVTARRALDRLAEEGLLERRPGAGTFVSARGPGEHALVADFANLLPHLVEMGRRTGVRLLSFAYGPAPAAVAEALGLEPGARAQASVRVRLIDGEPFSHLTTHVPERIGLSYSEADLAATPLLGLLERSGVTVARARQTVGASLAGPDVAEALGVAVGSPLLSLTRVVLDADDCGVEHLQALYRPDRYALRMDLARTGVRGERRWAPKILDPSPSRPDAASVAPSSPRPRPRTAP